MSRTTVKLFTAFVFLSSGQALAITELETCVSILRSAKAVQDLETQNKLYSLGSVSALLARLGEGQIANSSLSSGFAAFVPGDRDWRGNMNRQVVTGRLQGIRTFSQPKTAAYTIEGRYRILAFLAEVLQRLSVLPKRWFGQDRNIHQALGEMNARLITPVPGAWVLYSGSALLKEQDEPLWLAADLIFENPKGGEEPQLHIVIRSSDREPTFPGEPPKRSLRLPKKSEPPESEISGMVPIKIQD